MTSASDYGDRDSDTTLVPGHLTAYRHFALRPDGRRLAPMTDLSRNCYALHMRQGAAFHAECNVLKNYAQSGISADGAHHEAPSIDCSCGFYAHYSPTTDFYEGVSWRAVLEEDRMLVDDIYGYPSPTVEGYAIVRAVVALSGRIVMGHRGVRAEKLEVLALAVDWKKLYWDQIQDHWEYDNSLSIGQTIWQQHSYSPNVAMTRVQGPAPRIREQYERYARQAANLYNAMYFEDPAEMYERFPEPDLAALGIKKQERERPRVTISPFHIGGQIQAAIGQAALSVDELKKAMSDALGVDFGPGGVVTPKQQKKRPPKRVSGTFGAVIAAKQDRPAPPGTGIDRRKRKL